MNRRFRFSLHVLMALITGLANVLIVPLQAVAVTSDGELSSCVAVSTPHRVDTDTTSSFSFEITATDSIPVRWLRVIVPSSYYTITGANAPGWETSYNNEEVLLELGQIDVGAKYTFTITATSGIAKTPVEYWEVLASNNPYGADITTCTGDTSVAIGLLGPPTISNLNVLNLTSTSATIFWTTDRPASSLVEYGPTTRYGLSKASASFKTSHSLQLTDLKPSTGYHFRVASTEGDTTGYSSDNTFMTAALAPTTPTSPSNGTSRPDTSAPLISLSTSFAKPYADVPSVQGYASDDQGIAAIEYSIDGGRTWLPITDITPVANIPSAASKSTQVSYQFTPIITQDGNYLIQTRITDNGGNQTVTSTSTLIIDRFAPRFGASTLSVGPQPIQPDQYQTLVISSRLDHQFVTSLIGGPTTVTLTAMPLDNTETHTFSLSQDITSGLWKGVISLPRAGVYRLNGDAIDGAGNRTQRQLAVLRVLAPIHVLTGQGALRDATATLYYLNTETRRWTIWDAAAYSQTNPSRLDNRGTVGLLVPPGKYYLKVASQGASVITRTFTVDTPTPLSGLIRFQPPLSWTIGPWRLSLPWSGLDDPPLAHTASTAIATSSIGSKLPLVSLTTSSGQKLTPVTWYGKRTVIVQLATWSPSASEQLAALEQLRQNPDINVVAIITQEPLDTVAAYRKISGLSLDILTDPAGLLSGTLSSAGLPSHYFLDSRGIIKKIITRSLTAQQITNQLTHL